MADIHYVRQGEAKGLGHAVSVARQHVGGEPFAVLLGDDVMDERSHVLAGHARGARALRALGDRPQGGVARGDLLLRLGAVPSAAEDDLVRITDIVEKPKPEDAPSNLAVMGRYVFTPEIFDALEVVQPGKGGEIQLTDAIAILLREQTVYGYTFETGPLRHRQEARLPAGHRRAGARPRGPRSRVPGLPRRAGAAQETALSELVPLEDARRLILGRCVPLHPKAVALEDALGLRDLGGGRARPRTSRLRQLGHGRLRRTGAPTRPARPAPAAQSSPPSLRAASATSQVGPGRGGPDHDRCADPRRVPTPSSWSSAPRPTATWSPSAPP